MLPIVKSGVKNGSVHERWHAGKKEGPSYYTVRRHRLGGRIVSLVRLMMELDALSTAKAARILGIKPRQVQPLLDASRSL